MESRKARRIIQEMARRHGITEKKAAEDIEASIRKAISNAYKEKNRKVILRWKSIPCRGEIPTAYEFVAFLSEKAAKGEAFESEDGWLYS